MTEENIINKALAILKERIRVPGVSITSPTVSLIIPDQSVAHLHFVM